MELERFSSVLESIYDCSFDPGLWPQTMAEIAAYLNSSTARLFLFNNNPGREGFGSSVGLDSGFNEQFDKDLETLNSIKYGFIVAHLDHALTLDEILGANGGRDVNGNEAFDNRYYKDWMVPRGYHDAMAALIVKNVRHFGGLAMTRSLGQPRFADGDREKIRLLAPHIRRALTISSMIDQKTIERNRLADVIDALVSPVVIVDQRGQIIHVNATAGALLAAADTVRVMSGVLTAAHSESRKTLAQAIGEGISASLPLRKQAGGDLIASLMPLSHASNGRQRSTPHTAIFFHDLDREVQLPGEALAKLYKLTGAELRLLLALAQGASLQDISDRSGAALGTVRSHLKSLFAKTGKSRQSELVQLALMAASPMQ